MRASQMHLVVKRQNQFQKGKKIIKQPLFELNVSALFHAICSLSSSAWRSLHIGLALFWNFIPWKILKNPNKYYWRNIWAYVCDIRLWAWSMTRWHGFGAYSVTRLHAIVLCLLFVFDANHLYALSHCYGLFCIDAELSLDWRRLTWARVWCIFSYIYHIWVNFQLPTYDISLFGWPLAPHRWAVLLPHRIYHHTYTFVHVGLFRRVCVGGVLFARALVVFVCWVD